jgi:hypothetical protein
MYNQLVVVSACDHHTRVTVGGSLLSTHSPTIGLLFGNETTVRSESASECESGTDGSSSEVCSVHVIDATDAVYTYDAVADHLSLDMKQIQNKRDLWVQVYPTQPLLGWYAIGTEVTARHLSIHREISGLVSDPSRALMLLMNPAVDSNSSTKQLPLLLFQLETVQHTEIFVEHPFKVRVYFLVNYSITHSLNQSITQSLTQCLFTEQLESSPIESVVMDKVITSNPPENISPGNTTRIT